jgi:hypothetical protein
LCVCCRQTAEQAYCPTCAQHNVANTRRWREAKQEAP